MLVNTFMIVTGHVMLRPDWKNFVAEVKAPSNYKDPAKISDYIEKRMQGLEEEIRETTTCLFEASDAKFYIANRESEPSDTPEDSREGYLVQIFRDSAAGGQTSDIRILGSSAETILRAMYSEPFEGESVTRRDLRKLLFTCNLPFTSLEAMRFKTAERNLLLTRKLMPPVNGRCEADYIMDTLHTWGIVPRESWKVIQ